MVHLSGKGLKGKVRRFMGGLRSPDWHFERVDKGRLFVIAPHYSPKADPDHPYTTLILDSRPLAIWIPIDDILLYDLRVLEPRYQ